MNLKDTFGQLTGGIRKALDGFGGKLAGEKDLKRADSLLRYLASGSEDPKEKDLIRKTRMLLRKHEKEQRRRMLIAFFLVLVLLLVTVFLAFAGIRGRSGAEGTVSGKKNTSEKQTEATAEEAEASQENDAEETEELAGGAAEEAEPVELLLTFTGDFILGTDENFLWDTGFNAYYQNYGGSYFLENVRSIFEKDDLTIINFENVLSEETAREYKQFAFKGEPGFVDVLTTSSIEAANLANNHSSDYGEKSFTDTVQVLESNGIPTFGYDAVQILEVKGLKIGIFGIYELDEHQAMIPQMERNIQKLKDGGADILVGIFHWGNELEQVPDENQLTMGHLAVDLGVDVVVGHHPHVLQGIEQYKGKYIAYSLGNFCFGGNTHPTEMDTMIFQQRFVVKGKEIVESEINTIPCCVSSTWEYNDYKPTVMEGADAEAILQKIQYRSDAIPKDTAA